MSETLREWLARVLLLFITAGLVSACADTEPIPVAPPVPAVVKIPVPVACEIEKVPLPDYPKARADMGIYELTQTVLAERRVRMAETDRLRAASENPCPTPKENND